jgi:hypothetical protein
MLAEVGAPLRGGAGETGIMASMPLTKPGMFGFSCPTDSASDE